MTLGETLLDWMGRSRAAIETESERKTMLELRDAVAARAVEWRGRYAPGTRVPSSAGRGLAYWIDLLALWAADCVPVPVPREPSPALREAVKAACSHPSRGEAALWFTSGSTGTPKGVLLTAEGLLANAEASAARLAPPEGLRLLVPIPFTFISSLSHFLVALRCGATFLGRENACFPGSLLADAKGSGADGLGGAPLHLQWIEGTVGWRWLMASGDRLESETIKRLRARYPDAKLHVVYGMTELGGRACERLDDGEGGEATVGTPLDPIRVRVDPVTQEVQFSGPCLMLGYEGRGREGFTEDGWLCSGDVGELDRDGRLKLLGRKDDVFKCAGNKVSMLWIADGLWRTGEFQDVAVVAVDHPILGKVAHAYVVPLKDSWDPGTTLGRLRRDLPPDHLPHGFTRVEAIPRTGSGKLQRRSLTVPAPVP